MGGGGGRYIFQSGQIMVEGNLSVPSSDFPFWDSRKLALGESPIESIMSLKKLYSCRAEEKHQTVKPEIITIADFNGNQIGRKSPTEK